MKAFDYTALLMGAVLGDESGLRQMGNMADPWDVEVPGLLDGPGRCVISTWALPAATEWTHETSHRACLHCLGHHRSTRDLMPLLEAGTACDLYTPGMWRMSLHEALSSTPL